MEIFDAIVVGVGGMGSATLCMLAQRGRRVLGIERFGVAHSRGSSHGETRIIRRAYFEHPDYVPLVTRSFELWHQLESDVCMRLFEQSGLLLVGPADGPILAGVQQARAKHSLHIEDIERSEFRRRFPQFALPDGYRAMLEVDAGLLRVEECVTAYCQAALNAGAQLETGTHVTSWSWRGTHYVVETTRGVHRAQALVFCAGAWTRELLGTLGIPLRVRRKTALWFRCDHEHHGLERGAPVFGYEWNAGFFYGFPAVEPGVIKVAEHTGVEDCEHPDQVDRALRESDSERVRAFIRECLPHVHADELVRHSVCMYTMSPDEHFVLDRHPELPNCFIAAGFSGHGFKFAPVVGEMMADWVCGTPCAHAAEAFRLERLMPAATGR
jgi:sarcosine oxidase